MVTYRNHMIQQELLKGNVFVILVYLKSQLPVVTLTALHHATLFFSSSASLSAELAVRT